MVDPNKIIEDSNELKDMLTQILDKTKKTLDNNFNLSNINLIKCHIYFPEGILTLHK